MDDLRTTDVIVGGIAVGLQKAIELVQKLLRPFSLTPHAEIEDHAAPRSAVLPEIGLVVLAATVVHLHIDRRFIGLNITSSKQLLAHYSSDWHQQFAHAHYPAIHGGAADLDA